MTSEVANRKYSFDDNFEAVYLEFGNKAFGIWILLPHDDVSRESAENAIANGAFGKLTSKASDYRITVKLPKIKVNCTIPINEIFATTSLAPLTGEMDMTFLEQDFKGIIDLTNCSMLSWNEDEAEFASVSSEILDFSYSRPSGDDYTFTADRPFYFFITEFSTNICLLSGRISNL